MLVVMDRIMLSWSEYPPVAFENANLAQKQAPGIGTLLMFCAVELQIPESLAALVLVAIYALWHGNGRLFD